LLRRAAKTAKQTTASTAVTMAMQTATNFSRSFRIKAPSPLVDKFVEIVKNFQKAESKIGGSHS
jgi:hypothetical protein